MNRLIKLIVVLACAAGMVFPARSDTNAVTVTGGYTTAGLAIGAGFSFVPTTNVIVTSLQLYDAGLADAVVRIWTSSNTTIGTFVLGPTSNTFGVFSTNVSFVLGAGIRYSITVQDGYSDGSTHVPVQVYLPGSGTDITVAPDLTGYYPVLLATNHPLVVPAGLNAFLFGVNFSYVTTNLVWPALTIQQAPSNSVIVSWPPGSLDNFVLQTDTNLAVWDWRDNSPGPFGSSWTWTSTNVTISPATNNLFFRLRPALY